MKKLLIFISLFFTFNSGFSQHVGKLKLNICVWKFKDCGQVVINGEIHKVMGMNYMDYDSMYEITMYTYSKHIVTVQKTTQTYYFNVLYPDGRITCDEYPRGLLTNWVFNTFVSP
jgi:hypothetical protein